MPSRLRQDGYFETLVGHLLSQTALQINPCHYTSSLGLIGPALREQSKLQLGNRVMLQLESARRNLSSRITSCQKPCLKVCQ